MDKMRKSHDQFCSISDILSQTRVRLMLSANYARSSSLPSLAIQQIYFISLLSSLVQHKRSLILIIDDLLSVYKTKQQKQGFNSSSCPSQNLLECFHFVYLAENLQYGNFWTDDGQIMQREIPLYIKKVKIINIAHQDRYISMIYISG